MGGVSSEREVSLRTGNAILKILNQEGIDGVAIDPVNNFIEVLQKGMFDVAFIALHGPGGEGGSIQGLLDSINLPYTGSKVIGSAICMDKVATKRIWLATGLPTLPFFTGDPFIEVDEAIDLKWTSIKYHTFIMAKKEVFKNKDL